MSNDDSSSDDPQDDARAAVLSLLGTRPEEATICPSEVARKLGDGWRDFMPTVHAAVDKLLLDGQIELSWKGRRLAQRDGPYRIHRPVGDGTMPFSDQTKR